MISQLLHGVMGHRATAHVEAGPKYLHRARELAPREPLEGNSLSLSRALKGVEQEDFFSH